MKMPDVVGADVYDMEGNSHAGIIQFPVPMLRGNADILRGIRRKLHEPGFDDVVAVDFSDLAQGCKTYDEYIAKMSGTSEASLQYMGIAICGNKKKVNKLTGSLPLLQ